jgi:hypothetical protein
MLDAVLTSPVAVIRGLRYVRDEMLKADLGARLRLPPNKDPLCGVYDIHPVTAGCLPYGYDVARTSGAGSRPDGQRRRQS